ncbi:hypothetical protein [Bradyrhizobium sp. NP1]|uniref:hypothetical protein n=1 Tax=Bradyrhizobium sp. NP1 TaxID=3049772 RepID=UPI0025A5F96E|nr:hypothetical protein [Bradyrhizobium sp. NP1]WJR76500.1 hypothetical protein QOU61_27605 [Bradyrhizobium sp. NP1]
MPAHTPNRMQRFGRRARTRLARGAALSAAAARGPRIFRGYGFAPETIASSAICREFFLGTLMTAFLISLALAGLVTIVMCEVLS